MNNQDTIDMLEWKLQAEKNMTFILENLIEIKERLDFLEEQERDND